VKTDACGRNRRRGWWALGLLLVALVCLRFTASRSLAQDQPALTPTASASPDEAQTAAAPRDPQSYGLWVLAPAGIAIVITILTRQVIAALFAGVLLGAFLYIPCLALDAPFRDGATLVVGVRLALEKYLLGAIHEAPSTNYNHIKILVFTQLVALMVGIIGRNGGTAGMVRLVAGSSNSRRRGAVTAWLAGMVVFFDDYANCMIIGPTMRPVFDRLKLSRAKLAYIIDSTAAPVASLAIIGTWIGAEIGFIGSGLDQVVANGAPAFMIGADGHALTAMEAFLNSLPYRFYPILALFFTFLVCFLGRDFGPMHHAESRAISRLDDPPRTGGGATTTGTEAAPTWWLGLFPVLVLVAATLWILALTGLSSESAQAALKNPDLSAWKKMSEVISNADSYLSIMYGAFCAVITAAGLTLVSRTCKFREAMDAGLETMGRTFPAQVILILAWALSQVEQDLMLGQVVTAYLQGAGFPVTWLPTMIFAVSALISFATGTSWGTMGIVCPVAVGMAAGLAGDLPHADALNLFYASVGSVLAGAVFGDHCSPISDTTVLSSIGADCPHVEHVATQLPYALVSGVMAILAGTILCGVFGVAWYWSLGIGMVAQIAIVYGLGAPPKPTFALASDG